MDSITSADSSYSLSLEAQSEKSEYFENLNRNNLEKISLLQSSLESVSRQNETFESQMSTIKQHNQCLLQSANQLRNEHSHTKLLLSNANNKMNALNIELTNLQLLHQNKVTQKEIECNNTTDNINKTLKEYISENAQIKSENSKYLNQIKAIHTKYMESNEKNTDLSNSEMNIRNELNSAHQRINELSSLNSEYISEITHLRTEIADLKQNLSDITNSDVLSSAELAIKIVYSPIKRSNAKAIKQRSHFSSNSSSISVSLSNGVVHSLNKTPTNCDISDAELLLQNYDCELESEEQICDSHKVTELYHEIEDYLSQIEESILKKENSKLQSMTAQMRQCINEIRTQQTMDMSQMKTSFEELDLKFKVYKMQTKTKIEQMTREMCEMDQIIHKNSYKKKKSNSFINATLASYLNGLFRPLRYT